LETVGSEEFAFLMSGNASGGYKVVAPAVGERGAAKGVCPIKKD
jgi:hypothetical protein